MSRRLFGRQGREGERSADDQIWAVLRAAEDEGATASELCAAHGITLPEYCVWKRRYGGLTSAELRHARQREAARAKVRLLSALAAGVLAAGGFGLLLLPGADAHGAPGVVSPDATAGAAPASHVLVGDRPAPAMPAAAPGAQASPERAGAVDHRQLAEILPGQGQPAATGRAASQSFAAAPATPDGRTRAYAVQVAAVPSRQQALRAVERLSAAGYSAYLVASSVGPTEVFRVRVGPYRSWQEAEEMLPVLREEGFAAPWIVNGPDELPSPATVARP